MSKNSTKRNYQSLIEFLPTLGQAKVIKESSTTKFSKADHYTKHNVK
jgi:hypothetical protein